MLYETANTKRTYRWDSDLDAVINRALEQDVQWQ